FSSMLSRSAPGSKGVAARRLSGDELFVGGERQEVGELARQRHFTEDLRRGLEPRAELLELLALDREDTLAADAFVVDPLPDLRAADLRSRGVLHQIVDRRRADYVQPRGAVLDADRHVEADAIIGDTARCGRDI